MFDGHRAVDGIDSDLGHQGLMVVMIFVDTVPFPIELSLR